MYTKDINLSSFWKIILKTVTNLGTKIYKNASISYKITTRLHRIVQKKKDEKTLGSWIGTQKNNLKNNEWDIDKR